MRAIPKSALQAKIRDPDESEFEELELATDEALGRVEPNCHRGQPSSQVGRIRTIAPMVVKLCQQAVTGPASIPKRYGKGEMSSLADALHDLQDRLTGLTRYERIILDLAAVLAEDLHQMKTGSLPQRMTTIAVEDYLENRIPGRWEFLDGRPQDLEWRAYADGGE